MMLIRNLGMYDISLAPKNGHAVVVRKADEFFEAFFAEKENAWFIFSTKNDHGPYCTQVEEASLSGWLPLFWNTKSLSQPPRNRRIFVPDSQRKIKVAHFAENLSGEEQPPFSGWFVEVTPTYCHEISAPECWASIPGIREKTATLECCSCGGDIFLFLSYDPGKELEYWINVPHMCPFCGADLVICEENGKLETSLWGL